MELVAAILGVSALDFDVDQIADAIWLSQFLTGRERQAPRVTDTAPGGDPGTRPDAEPAEDAQAPRPPEVDSRAGTEPAPVPSTVDVERAPPAGAAATRAARFRSPAASALTQQLELARALRPLAWRSPRPGAWRVVEDVTADRIARTGLWLAELEPETDPALDLIVLVDASPRLHVWQRITRELIDVLRSSSAFRTTTIWRVAGDQVEVVLRAAGGAVRVGGHSVVDAARTTAMLVISDFVGPLWSSAAGLACLRLWSRCMTVALVSLVPQRSWGRSLLGTLPATRLTAARRGAPSAALNSEAAVVAGAIPVPVVSIDPASFGTWARLVAGRAQARARGVLVLPDVSVAARARYAAAAIYGGRGGSPDELAAEIAEAIRTNLSADEPRDARERVERFCRTHRPEVVELAAALTSTPLELSVMLVVQRAVAPHTGTLELAEIVDSGLLEIEPPRPDDDEVRFRIADDVRDHLSPRASIGDHLRVLEVVGAYLRDHLGSSIDFEALVVHPSRSTGPIAGKERRYARMFVDELRRLGIDTAALDPAAPEPPAPPAPEDQSSSERSGATAAIAPFSGRWVAVVGTSLGEFPTPAKLAAEALGRELAQRGFGLRTRGWKGADSIVATSFTNTLKASGAEVAMRLETRLHGGPRLPSDAGAIFGAVIAVVLVGGDDLQYSLSEFPDVYSIPEFLRAGPISMVPFRGSGGVADHEVAQQGLPPRPTIEDETQATAEAALVVERLCALVVGPDRASAFSQLRKRLSEHQPAFARQLRLDLDGRVTITASTVGPDGRPTFTESVDRPGPAVPAEIVRVADGASLAVLAVAFELLVRLRAWKSVMVLAASSSWQAGEAMSAAVEASCMFEDARSRFALWRHVAPGANSPLATLHAVEAAAATGDLAVARHSLEGLSGLLDTDYDEMRERLLRIAENDADAEAAIGLLRRLIDVSLWLGEPFEALRAVRRWIARAPNDQSAIDVLGRLFAHGSAADRIQQMFEAAKQAGGGGSELLRRFANSLAQEYPNLAQDAAIQELLERQAELGAGPAGADGTAGSVDRNVEIARLLSGQLGRPGEALEHWSAVLAAEPEHPIAIAAVETALGDPDLRLAAAAILRPIYAASAHYDRLAELQLRAADWADDAASKLRAYREVVELREHRLGDAPGAFEAQLLALHCAAAEPELAHVIADTERLAGELGREADLIDAYRAVAPNVLDATIQRRLYLDVADLSRAVRKDLPLAGEYYQKVLDGQPDDRRALVALERIYRDTNDDERLIEILLRQADSAHADVDERVGALVEAAGLYVTLDRPDDAIATWEQVLEVAPERRDVVAALEALYREQGRWPDVVELYERRLGFATSIEEAVALRVQLGDIHERHLHDVETAIDNYAAALGGDSHHAVALTAIERYLEDPDVRMVAAEVLEPIYVAQQRWVDLIRVYEAKLESASDPRERLRLTRFVARLFDDQLEDFEKASRWYARLFRELPSDPGIRDQLHRLASIGDNWAFVAQTYQDYLDAESGDSSDLRDVAIAAATIYDRRLGEVDRAFHAYRRALAIADDGVPDARELVRRLEDLLGRHKRWAELIAIYDDVIASDEDDLRREALIKRARLCEDGLGDAGRAIEGWREVLVATEDGGGASTEHAYREAVTELERLYRERSAWHDLVALFKLRLVRARQPAEIVELRLKLADASTRAQ